MPPGHGAAKLSLLKSEAGHGSRRRRAEGPGSKPGLLPAPSAAICPQADADGFALHKSDQLARLRPRAPSLRSSLFFPRPQHQLLPGRPPRETRRTARPFTSLTSIDKSGVKTAAAALTDLAIPRGVASLLLAFDEDGTESWGSTRLRSHELTLPPFSPAEGTGRGPTTSYRGGGRSASRWASVP